MIRTKDARNIRLGIENAHADIKKWGDNHGSIIFKAMLVSTMDTKLLGYPRLFNTAYRVTISKFFERGGNIDGD